MVFIKPRPDNAWSSQGGQAPGEEPKPCALSCIFSAHDPEEHWKKIIKKNVWKKFILTTFLLSFCFGYPEILIIVLNSAYLKWTADVDE